MELVLGNTREVEFIFLNETIVVMNIHGCFWDMCAAYREVTVMMSAALGWFRTK